MIFIFKLFLYIFLVHSTYSQNSSVRPHIILIVADDLGWNDVSWHNEEVLTPHLEKLAREGIILNRSYVQPICSPTRSALLTGRYPFKLGRQNNVIFPPEPTGLTLNVSILPEELKSLGYATHAVGKWHLGFCKKEYTPTFRGFDSFLGYYCGSEDYYSHDLGFDCSESGSHPCHGYDFRNNTDVYEEAKGDYSAFVFADRVDEIVNARDPNEPMFLYLPFQSVHAPLQAPQEYIDLYPNVKDISRRTYLGMVSAMDDAIGRVINSLKNTNHYENSVIVFTTDNGGPTRNGANNYPLRGNKTTLWEGGTRGAAFLHSHWLNSSQRVTDSNSSFDGDGVNQWEALTEPSSGAARDYFVYDIDNTEELRAAVRWGDYKLIVGNPGPGDWSPQFEDQDIIANGTNFQLFDEVSDEPLINEDNLTVATNITAPKIALYNVHDDPRERNDISSSHHLVVGILYQRLMIEMKSYVKKDTPSYDVKADPANYNGTWSPGWC